jgi:integrator complex subunit 11
MNPAVKSVFTKRNVFDFKFVQQSDKNLGDADIPMVIFATPGMLHGGLSLSIFKDHIAHDKKNCVIIPGYCSMGTVGNRIISGEKKLEIDNEIVIVNCEVYYMSFSAHADAKGLLQLIKNIQPKNIILVHGEYEIMKKFKSTCIGKRIKNDIIMPANNEEIDFKKFNLIRHINITKDVFDIIKCLFYLKKENKNINISLFNLGILFNNDIRYLIMNKVNLFNGKKIKTVINNKISYSCNDRNILEIFKNFLVLYYSKISKYYFDLVHNKKKLNIQFIKGNKIIFSFKCSSDKFDDILDTKKIYKIIQIFQKINNIYNL